MEKKKGKKVVNSLIDIDFNSTKMVDNTIKGEFNGVEFDIIPVVGYDRFISISRALLNGMRIDMVENNKLILDELDIYRIVSNFKKMIVLYNTNVNVENILFPVLEECGFMQYVLSKIVNFDEMFHLLTTEISILNSQLLILHLTNSIPSVDESTEEFGKSINELSEKDKELLELVLGKRLKDEVVAETKMERLKKVVDKKKKKRS